MTTWPRFYSHAQRQDDLRAGRGKCERCDAVATQVFERVRTRFVTSGRRFASGGRGRRLVTLYGACDEHADEVKSFAA